MSATTFNDLLNEIDQIPVVESRINAPGQREFVMMSDLVMQTHLALQKFFGEQFKAPGEVPSSADKKHAARWGGIRDDQTLYYRQKENDAHCAMLWPWSDGRRYTVKIFHNRTSKSQETGDKKMRNL